MPMFLFSVGDGLEVDGERDEIDEGDIIYIEWYRISII